MDFFDDARNLIDARGSFVTLPTEDIKYRLAKSDEPYLITIVDNHEDRDKVLSIAREMNLKAKVYNEESGYYIRIEKEEVAGLPTELSSDFEQVILVTSDKLGQGEDLIGRDLMGKCLKELTGSDVLPQTIIFVNSGVFLVCEGSPALGELMELERRKVRIFACDQSLSYYGLREKLCLGTAIKVFTMVNYLTAATKVLTLG